MLRRICRRSARWVNHEGIVAASWDGAFGSGRESRHLWADSQIWLVAEM